MKLFWINKEHTTNTTVHYLSTIFKTHFNIVDLLVFPVPVPPSEFHRGVFRIVYYNVSHVTVRHTGVRNGVFIWFIMLFFYGQSESRVIIKLTSLVGKV